MPKFGFWEHLLRALTFHNRCTVIVTVSSCSHRAVVEERALRFGRRLLLEQFDTISDVVQQAEKQRHDGKKPFFEFSAGSVDRIGSHSVATAVEP